jgi:hypothetical protein
MNEEKGLPSTMDHRETLPKHNAPFQNYQTRNENCLQGSNTPISRCLRRSIRILMAPAWPLRPIAIIITALPTPGAIIEPASTHIRAARPANPICIPKAIFLIIKQTQLAFIRANTAQQPGILVAKVIAHVRHAVHVLAHALEVRVRAYVDVARIGFGGGRWRGRRWRQGCCGREVARVYPGGPGDVFGIDGGGDGVWGDGDEDAVGGAVGLGGRIGAQEQEKDCGVDHGGCAVGCEHG